MPATPKSLERLLAKKFMAKTPAMHKTASVLADVVLLRCKLAAMREEDVAELANDLNEQMSVRGIPAAQASLPHPDLQDVLALAQQEKNKKSLSSVGSVAAGGAIGGLSGALLAALTKGREHAISGGMLGVIPGSIAGYVTGKKYQQRKDLEKLLRDRLTVSGEPRTL
jgi:hypothetical protein